MVLWFRLLLTTRDDESGIKSITCTIYDVTRKTDIWTTTQESRRLPRVHSDDVEPEAEGPGSDEELHRPKRVRHDIRITIKHTSNTSSINLIQSINLYSAQEQKRF